MQDDFFSFLDNLRSNIVIIDLYRFLNSDDIWSNGLPVTNDTWILVDRKEVKQLWPINYHD